MKQKFSHFVLRKISKMLAVSLLILSAPSELLVDFPEIEDEAGIEMRFIPILYVCEKNADFIGFYSPDFQAYWDVSSTSEIQKEPDLLVPLSSLSYEVFHMGILVATFTGLTENPDGGFNVEEWQVNSEGTRWRESYHGLLCGLALPEGWVEWSSVFGTAKPAGEEETQIALMELESPLKAPMPEGEESLYNEMENQARPQVKFPSAVQFLGWTDMNQNGRREFWAWTQEHQKERGQISVYTRILYLEEKEAPLKFGEPIEVLQKLCKNEYEAFCSAYLTGSFEVFDPIGDGTPRVLIDWDSETCQGYLILMPEGESVETFQWLSVYTHWLECSASERESS